MSVQGRVTLKDNQALVVLNVATNNNQAEERPRSDLEALLNRALRQEVPVHPTRLPLLRKHLAAMVCNVQKGLHLDPVGLHGAWNAAAEQRLLECLTKPKRVVTPKPVVPAIAAPAPVLQLEDGKVSDSSSTSDSSYSDSSSSTSSEEEAMPEYVPNPSLPPPPDLIEVLTDDEYLAPPAPAAPCEESHERPAKCQRCQEREEEFWSLAESHQLIAEWLEAAEQENARLRAQR
eukprot:s557_g15.t1